MPRKQTLPRSLATAARWPIGVSLTSWRYMWRTTPLYRREDAGSWPEDAPPLLPEGVDRTEMQQLEDGVGPLFHRRYSVRVRDARLGARELIARLREDPDRAAPTEFATFKKLAGDDRAMSVGDEYVVRMPGPWDGPVRVVRAADDGFRLATLDGHLEAGQIEFTAVDGDELEFTIESWARSGDRLSNLLYHRLRMSKEVQLHMWTSFLERVVKLSGGRRQGGLRIHTRRVEVDPLDERPINFDLERLPSFTRETGWNVDDYCQPLPAEAPGAPAPGGTWERARELMRRYEFADPRIVRAIQAPDPPRAGHDMLLEARFHGLRFRFGVRVAGVVDQTRDVRGREVRVWGWSYHTLQGHLEMGQMDYEVWKWLDNGEVEFRIHVVSRAARIPNPIVRLGFRLFGRSEQTRFARRACERMTGLLAEDSRISTRRPCTRAITAT